MTELTKAFIKVAISEFDAARLFDPYEDYGEISDKIIGLLTGTEDPHTIQNILFDQFNLAFTTLDMDDELLEEGIDIIRPKAEFMDLALKIKAIFRLDNLGDCGEVA